MCYWHLANDEWVGQLSFRTGMAKLQTLKLFVMKINLKINILQVKFMLNYLYINKYRKWPIHGKKWPKNIVVRNTFVNINSNLKN